jgi:hypothetical protein
MPIVFMEVSFRILLIIGNIATGHSSPMGNMWVLPSDNQ